MDNKLLRFFNEIKFDEAYFEQFKDAKIDKVEVNTKKKIWVIHISFLDLINVEVFELLCNQCKTFEKVDKIYFKFKYENGDELLSKYFYYYFDKLISKCPMLESIKNNNITFENNLIKIETLNQIELNKINEVISNIKTFLEDIGFSFEIETFINETARVEVKKMIEKKVEVKKENKNEISLIKGSEIKGEISKIKNVITEENNIIFEAFIFDLEIKETNSKFTIFTLKISDYTDSIVAKIFSSSKKEIEMLSNALEVGSWYKFKGYIKHDIRLNDYAFNIRDIEKIKRKVARRIDEAPEKRVELHLHTIMSQMDGIIDPKKLLKKLNTLGHTAVGVTDKNSVQAFPNFYKNKGDIKVLFGAEIFVVDDEVKIITKETDETLDGTFVVFDVETTGLNAFGGDSIIEIGAVKIKKGKIIDKFNELINPGVKLRDVITQITKITDKMLKDKDSEEIVIKRFFEWCGDAPMVAHNAKFDVSFIKSAFIKYGLGEFNNTVVDTLELSRAIDPDTRSHSLSSLVKKYDVEFDENAHHRADYDAEATALVFHKMILEIGSNYKVVKDLNNLINIEHILKTSRPFHITIFAKNNIGLKNLFKIISYANTKYFYKTPRILRSELINLREGLIIGSGCSNGEIFEAAKTKSEEDLVNMMMFYDFIEVNPPSILTHLIESEEFANELDLMNNIKKIIFAADSIDKLVCATGDVHTLDPDDNKFREILVSQKQPGGGFHPLYRSNIKTIPNAFLRTTDEMLSDFEFLGEEKAKEIVITNTNKIVFEIEDVEVIKKGLFSPKMENSAEIIKELVYKNAKETYGEELPKIISERLDKELTGIIGGKYDVIYLIAQKLVKLSNDDGYIVGSRGSVGSSLVATFLNITEVNPLSPHYVCPVCKKSIFEENGEPLAYKYGSGFDMPDKICECGAMFKKQGQDIPFETFLGFNADKTPDIDLNFSGEYQAKAHDYTKILFGADNVFRAGTVSTIAEKTAYGFVKGYLEDKGFKLRSAEIERLAQGITGVKRTSGQHPGGIIVIPDYKDVFDFTPYQYPAENINASWYTTHFEFHDIEENVLKLDILGHDDPTALKYLCDDVNITIDDIPLDDRKVLSLFSSTDILNLKEDIGVKLGTLGVPEFGTTFAMRMLEEIKPQTFADLIKICGLAHGTDVWVGNARDVILKGICEFKDVIGCRDDIMLYLIKMGIEKAVAFKISEFIRKGKAGKDVETWEEFKKILKEKEIPAWYIDCCQKIKYMFPKAHAAAYVINAFRVAWFKVYHPLEFYRIFLSIRRKDFEIDAMIQGKESVKKVMMEIQEKGFNASNKETEVYITLEVAYEMLARGYHFENISLTESDAVMFKINKDKTGLIPPFITLEGMGETAATKLVEERNLKSFVSIEDLQMRGKVSQTIIDKLRTMNVLEELPESSQLSLF